MQHHCQLEARRGRRAKLTGQAVHNRVLTGI